MARWWRRTRRAVTAVALAGMLGSIVSFGPTPVAALESYGGECPPDRSQRGVYLYDLPDFQGKCSYFTGDGPNADLWHIGNDAAQSLRIVGALMAVLWMDQIFGGVGTAFINEGQIANLDLYPCPAAACVRNKQVTSLMVRFIPPDGPQSGVVDATRLARSTPRQADLPVAAPLTDNGLPPTDASECQGYGVFLF
ncbi:MAG: hypothetical protein NZ518_10170, partial [Dehalococcoidia bacterium]|nr:hypothetical protein [Dehalococcoidia bacterium]